MKATRPQKTANEPLLQAAVRRFSNTQSTPRVVIPPPLSHARKIPSAGRGNRNFSKREKRSRSPAGPRRLGTATRISASLSRRLSAFFGSTHDQAQKAAKYAVLTPGHAGFPNRVKRSEGSDTTPTQNATCFAVCALVCDPLSEAEGVPTFASESERGPFARKAEKRNEERLGIKFIAATLPEFFPLLI